MPDRPAVARPLQYVDALTEPGHDLVEAHRSEAGGGELDRQRHAVESTADLPDHVQVVVVDGHAGVSGSLTEQLHRPARGVDHARQRQGERRQRDDRLVVQRQRRTTRRHDHQPRTGPQHGVDGGRRRVGHMLTVVHDDDVTGELGRAEHDLECREPEVCSDRPCDSLASIHPAEVDESTLGWAAVERGACGASQRGLADAARPDDRHQAPPRPDPGDDLRQLALAADRLHPGELTGGARRRGGSEGARPTGRPP